MHVTDLKKPFAKFKCGELEEHHPEAHKAFKDDFLCSIEMVDFYVDAEGTLYADAHDSDLYEWQPAYDDEPGEWLDTERF